MTEQHKATPEQWKLIGDTAAAPGSAPGASTIIELRARVEALEARVHELQTMHSTAVDWRMEQDHRLNQLEATQHAHIEGSHDRRLEIHEYRPSMPTTPSPAGSLVERVQRSIDDHPFGEEACTTILEVAAWLRNLPGWEGSTLDAIGALLEQEATR